MSNTTDGESRVPGGDLKIPSLPGQRAFLLQNFIASQHPYNFMLLFAARSNRCPQHLKPASLIPPPSVNLETVMVLSLGSGSGSGSGSSASSSALCFRVSIMWLSEGSCLWQLSNLKTSSASYRRICTPPWMYSVGGQTT